MKKSEDYNREYSSKVKLEFNRDQRLIRTQCDGMVRPSTFPLLTRQPSKLRIALS
jgi:hypothetical protein